MLKEITTDKIEIQDIQNSKQFYNTEVDFDAYKKHKDELEKEWNALGKENQKEFGTIKKFFQDKLPPYSDEELNRARHYSLLKNEVDKLTVGSPEENSIIVPLIDKKSADYVQGLIDDALAKGATLVCGNKREGNLIYPTLLDNVTLDMRIAWEEPFGPVLPVIRVNSDEEAIKIANESEFGLQASIFTQNIDRAFNIAPKLEVGTVQVNGRTERGPDHLPFLGVKSSGMGVQGIRKSIESMTIEKVTVININR